MYAFVACVILLLLEIILRNKIYCVHTHTHYIQPTSGEYCSNHNTALNTIKSYQTGDHRFSAWYKHKESNPLLKRKGLNGFTLSVSHRLTKYPILIDAQLKKVGSDNVERTKLEEAKRLIKEILDEVNACVAEQNKEDRRIDIFKRIDAKSTIMFKNTKFRKSDIMDMNRKLK